MKYNIYFAGSLFHHKDLIGNAMLAEKIKTIYPFAEAF